MITSATFESVDVVFHTRQIQKLLTVNVLVFVLVSKERPFVYPADAHAVCLIVLVMAGIEALRVFPPL